MSDSTLSIVFALFSLAVAAGVVGLLARFGSRRLAAMSAVGLALWAAGTWLLADTGALAVFTLPPRLFLVFVPGLMLTAWLARVAAKSGVTSAPAALLIGLQLFRLPVELLIHQAVSEGIAPPQMTWPWPGGSGMNPDVLTALTAPFVALAVHRGFLGRSGVIAWNLFGLLMLATVVIVGLVSMPTPFQLLKPDNTWIAHAPWVWLPTLLVTTAILLHLLSIKAVNRPEFSGVRLLDSCCR